MKTYDYNYDYHRITSLQTKQLSLECEDFDCEYNLPETDHYKNRPEPLCPGGSNYLENCPLLIGDPPCKSALKCKIRWWQGTLTKPYGTQKTLISKK
jgi:hypothetical protein